MGFDWSTVGGGRLFAGLLFFALTSLVFFTRPSGRQNRRLALLFLLMGGTEAARGLAILSDNAAQARGFWAVTIVQFTALPLVELLFLATLRSPLVAWLRVRWVDVLLMVGAVVVPFPLWLLTRPERLPFIPGEDILVRSLANPELLAAAGPVTAVVFAAYGILLFAIAVAISALRRAEPGTLARRQARVYLAAFAVSDGWWLTVNGIIRPFLAEGSAFWTSLSNYGGPFAAQPVFAVLLTYGILKTHLFDIDLRVKWTIRRGTVALGFVAVVVAVLAGFQEWLGQTQGITAAAVAAGLMVFALQPMQRLADRLSEAALPEVQDSPGYRRERKLDVYRDAVETLMLDGNITKKERLLLVRLRSQLGLTQAETSQMERHLGAPASA